MSKITGTRADDSLSGGYGDDVINGGDGNDTLYGGSNSDTLYGDAGDDRLTGGSESDTLVGGDGNDVFVLSRELYSYNDIDTITDFDKGHDRIDLSGLGVSSLSTALALASSQQGGDGSTQTRIATNYSGGTYTLVFGASKSLLGSGDFILATTMAPQNLTGTPYNDDLFGGAGNDTLVGGSGNDRLFGDAGNDSLLGGIGSDTLFGGGGNDVFVLEKPLSYGENNDSVADFTKGQDVIDVSGLGISSLSVLQAVAISQQASDGSQLTKLTTFNSGFVNGFTFAANRLQLGSGDFIFSTAADARNLSGSSGADDLFGGMTNDTLVGGAGNDRLFGDAGDDRLAGGLGLDTLVGGAGNDVFVLLRPADAYDYYGDSDIITDFSKGQDRIDVSSLGISSLSTVLALATAQRALDGSQQTQIAVSYANNTGFTTFGANMALLGSGDFIFATISDAQSLTGTSYNDDLFGGAGNDILVGGKGNDRLFGDVGDDRLIGGPGDNTLSGGAGNDVFVLDMPPTWNTSHQIIADFTKGQDRIDVSALGISSLATAMVLATTRTGASGAALTDITVRGENTDSIVVTLAGTRDSLGSGDFIFASTSEDLLLTGTFYGEDLFGSAGNDAITADGGDDRLFGEAGDDRLIGGAGNDTLYGGAGKDVFVLEFGTAYFGEKDVLPDFTPGVDRIDLTEVGIGSYETLSRLMGSVQVSGGPPQATVSIPLGYYKYTTQINASPVALSARDFIFSDSTAAQTLTAAFNYDATLIGLRGNDTLVGDAGNDLLLGDAGADSLIGGAGSDTLYGGAGNDVFVIRRSDRSDTDLLADFKQGQDRIDVSALGIGNFQTLQYVLSTGSGTLPTLTTVYNGCQVQTVIDVQAVSLRSDDFIFLDNTTNQGLTGTSAADDLFGGGGHDTISGGSGNDRLFGDAGNDRLIGGAGDDTLYGGAGNDVFVLHKPVYYEGRSTDTIADFTQGQDRVDVSDLGICSMDVMRNLLRSVTSADGKTRMTELPATLDSGQPVTTIGIDPSLLRADDFIFATVTAPLNLTVQSSFVGADLFGGAGKDTLTGGGVADRLFGDAGDDRLTGGGGNDTLYGGSGTDTAIFSGTRDRYEITTSNGATSVRDLLSFGDGTDTLYDVEKLQFKDMTISTPSVVLPTLTLVGGKVGEGDDGRVDLVYKVVLSATSTSQISYTLAVTGGTASLGTDFTVPNYSSAVSAGVDSWTIKLSVIGDTRPEANETVTLTLSNLVGATLANNASSVSATGIILNDDADPDFTLSAYKALNPDLAAVFGGNDVAYVRHYISNGRAEGRVSTGFDAEAYAAQNPDLFRAFGLDATSLAGHYRTSGKAEGRVTDGFDADAYAAQNPDLFRAFGTDHAALIKHYISNGKAEGRVATGFDVEAYAALNGDLYRAFGLDAAKLIGHYISNGQAEGRLSQGFDAETYAALNPDLLNAFGLDHSALINHYIQNGRAEGRVAFTVELGFTPALLGLIGAQAAPALIDLG